MAIRHRLFNRSRLLLGLGVLLAAAFVATTLGSYEVSRRAVRDAIVRQELPLTSSNIYSEIQKDLVRPILISSTMASDTFLRDWVLGGERNVDAMSRYLGEVKKRYGAFSSFFVSERSAAYYTADGVLKHVAPQEPRDTWYYRVRDLKDNYEINVDPDLANRDALTIFINYRVFDYDGRYIGATGIGLTVNAVRTLIADYQERFQRTIYFVDAKGQVVLFGGARLPAEDIHAIAGLKDIADDVLAHKSGSYEYDGADGSRLLNVNYIPELKWFLFVEKGEDGALADIRHALYVNLGICLVATLVVLLLIHLALSRYQERLEEMATTDKLTGLLNRQGFDVIIGRLKAEYFRQPRPLSMLLVDVDHFKPINDKHGHQTGDVVLTGVAQRLRQGLRASDIAVRWGGEEFLLVLPRCNLEEAARIADKLRQDIAGAPFEAGTETLAITVSIGVAQYEAGEDVDHTVDRADSGLYLAKASGRNRVCAAPQPSGS